MGAIILFGGIIIIVSILAISYNNNKYEDFYNKVGKAIPCNYYGGFRTISNCNECRIYRYKDNTNIVFEVYGNNQRVIKTIPVSLIKGCGIINSQQIQEKVTLGKLLVFGLPALAMKGKNNVLTEEFVKIDLQDNDNSIISIILKVKILKNSDLVNMINEVCGFNYL